MKPRLWKENGEWRVEWVVADTNNTLFTFNNAFPTWEEACEQLKRWASVYSTL